MKMELISAIWAGIWISVLEIYRSGPKWTKFGNFGNFGHISDEMKETKFESGEWKRVEIWIFCAKFNQTLYFRI